MIDTASIFSLIDFSGVLAGVLGGALEAKLNRTYQFDFVGVPGIATCCCSTVRRWLLRMYATF